MVKYTFKTLTQQSSQSQNNIMKQKQIEATITVIVFGDYLIFYQMFLSPQVKQSLIVSNKHSICELSHKHLR